jgi:hypothetical protein
VRIVEIITNMPAKKMANGRIAQQISGMKKTKHKKAIKASSKINLE